MPSLTAAGKFCLQVEVPKLRLLPHFLQVPILGRAVIR